MQKIGLVTLFDIEDERYLAYLASNTRLFILECENKPVIHRTPSLCYFLVPSLPILLVNVESLFVKHVLPALKHLDVLSLGSSVRRPNTVPNAGTSFTGVVRKKVRDGNPENPRSKMSLR